MLGIPNPFNGVNWPNFGGLGLGLRAGGETPYYLISSFFTVEDNATKVIGKHELQFGVAVPLRDDGAKHSDDRVARLRHVGDLALRSGFHRDGAASAAADRFRTGESCSSASATISATFGRPWVFMRKNEWAPYIQDTWKCQLRG